MPVAKVGIEVYLCDYLLATLTESSVHPPEIRLYQLTAVSHAMLRLSNPFDQSADPARSQ